MEIITRNRKSVRLEKDVLIQLRRNLKRFATLREGADRIGISDSLMNIILIRKTTSSETLKKIIAFNESFNTTN